MAKKKEVVEAAKNLSKTDMIREIASTSDLTQGQVGEVIDSFIEKVGDTLEKGAEVRLMGFGTFYASKRKSYQGRNPQDGSVVTIPATTCPKFRTGTALKERLNNK